MKKTVAVLLALITFAALLSSCRKEEETPSGGLIGEDGTLSYPEAVLYLNERAVSFDEARYYYLNYRDMHLSEDPDAFSSYAAQEALKEEVLSYIRDVWAIRFWAEETGITLTQEDYSGVRADIEETERNCGGAENFEKELSNSYMSRAFYEEMMAYSRLYLKLFDSLYGENGTLVWDDETFYRYYRENYLAVQVLFLPYEDAESEAEHPAANAAMENVLALLEKGSDFWDLVLTYGKDEQMLAHPEGLYVREGEAEDALFQAASALNVGDVSGVTVGSTGLYLMRRVELREDKMDEQKKNALSGYYDAASVWHAGAYDEAFQNAYRERAKTITVRITPVWEAFSSTSVF